MTFSQAITAAMGKYATTSGRATRSEYWWFYLFTVLMSWGSAVAGTLVGGETMGTILNLAVSLALLIPATAVAVRRLHDTGRSGWWLLLSLTIIGIIPLIIWLASEGDSRANSFGEPPNNSQGDAR